MQDFRLRYIISLKLKINDDTVNDGQFFLRMNSTSKREREREKQDLSAFRCLSIKHKKAAAVRKFFFFYLIPFK